jgi:hypothetical protein
MDKVALQDKDCKATGNEWMRSVVLGRLKKAPCNNCRGHHIGFGRLWLGPYLAFGQHPLAFLMQGGVMASTPTIFAG